MSRRVFAPARVGTAINILLVVFIAHLSVGLSADTRERRFYEVSVKNENPEPADENEMTEEYKDYLLKKWKEILLIPQAPVIEMQLMKGHVRPDEAWGVGTEYIYSPKEFQKQKEQESRTEEEKQKIVDANNDGKVNADKDEEDMSAWKDSLMPFIGSRNIITAPSYCPKGQRMVKKGVCKTIIPSKTV